MPGNAVWCRASWVAKCSKSNVNGGLAEAAHPMVLAISVQCGEERASAGAVVKPTWLLMIKWIVPPVEKPAITETKYACAARSACAYNLCLSGKICLEWMNTICARRRCDSSEC